VSNANDWVKYAELAGLFLSGLFTVCSGIFAFFMKREMAHFDEDRATIRRLDKESVSWDGLNQVLEQLRDERRESRADHLRMHTENREEMREFKSVVREGLKRLETTIEAHERINLDSRQELAGDLQQLTLTVAKIGFQDIDPSPTSPNKR
jgi:flagellar motility protein MotE (MotC chaperone)